MLHGGNVRQQLSRLKRKRLAAVPLVALPTVTVLRGQSVAHRGLAALVSSVVLLSASPGAHAADWAPQAVAPVHAPSPLWQGFYVGSSFAQAYTPGEGDFLGGGLIGYNWQFGSGFVAGVEVDGAVLNGSAISAMASARMRGGFAMGRVLVFGTFGLAGVTTRERAVLADRIATPDLVSNRSQTRLGATAGAGVLVGDAESREQPHLRRALAPVPPGEKRVRERDDARADR